MENYNNLSAAVIDSENLEISMMTETFFNNDDSVVRKMKQKFNKDIMNLPYKQRMELKECGEEITAAYKMTKAFSVINGTDQLTPKQYIYSMMKKGWEGWNLLAVSPYLSNELEEVVLKYFVAPKNILK
jgi:hypothetical protein